MNYRTLGRTGLRCSEIGLGTWAFASQVYGPIEETEAVRTIREAVDAGVTFFDTAPLYGTPERDGVAEHILGRGLGASRTDVIVSTKFGRNPTDNNAPNFHAARARSSVEASLRRLDSDYIDVLFFHSPFHPNEIHDDVWDTLDRFREEGKIRYIGHSISMFNDTQGMARDWAAAGRIDVVQVVYSLMNREAASLIDDLGAMDIGIVARESMANGFLSGAVTRDTVFPPGHLNARYSREEIAARVDYVNALDFLVRGPVASMPQAAMRWVLDSPAVSLVLSGARNVAELEDALAASEAPAYTPEERDRAARLHTQDFEAA